MKTIHVVCELVILLVVPGGSLQLFVYTFSGVPSVGSIMKNFKSQKRYFGSIVVEILVSQVQCREKSPHYCYFSFVFIRLRILGSCIVEVYSITS